MYTPIFRKGLACLAALFMAATPSLQAQDLSDRSARFDEDSDLAAFQQLTALENADYEPWRRIGVHQGHLVLEPGPAAFYRDYRGPAVIQSISGDFMVTTDLHVTDRRGQGRPDSAWNTAGLIVRRPRTDLGPDWQAGRENHLRIGVGTVENAEAYAYEVYDTRNSVSRYQSHAGPENGAARLRIVRRGPYFLFMAAGAGEDFALLRRSYRPDLPETVQVGLYALTDWSSIEGMQPAAYNQKGAGAGKPNVRVAVDEILFARPALSRDQLALNWTRGEEIPDARVLELLGTDSPAERDLRAAASPVRPRPDRPLRDRDRERPRLADRDARQPAAPTARQTAGEDAVWADEFDDAASLRDWKRIKDTDGKGAEQLKTIDVNKTRKGHLTLIPHTVVWYENWRGPLVYREVTGNFVVTTEIETQRRGGGGAPRSSYSLCGIMLRTPVDTSGGWRAGQENYIFLSTGSARVPGQYQLEVKTTINSKSTLEVTPNAPKRVVLRAVRLDEAVILMRKEPGGDWQVHARYHRRDFPETLQVGITCYTDWDTASKTPPAQHNVSVIKNGNPDLEAYVDYVRIRNFSTDKMPAEYRNRNYADPNDVADSFFLRYFGAALD